MKKSLKFIIPLLMLGLIFSAQNIRAAYNVTAGIYVYDVNESSTDITFGVNTATVEGFTVDGQAYPEGTAVNLNVTNVVAGEVNYNITVDEYSENHTTIPSDSIYLFELMTYPFILLGDVALNTWNQSEIEALHLGILMLPFLSVEATTWTDWIEVVNDLAANKTLLSETFSDGITIRAKYTNTTSSFLVEVYYRGDISEDITGIDVMSIVDVNIEHKLLFGYNKTTGLMLGMKMEGSIEGTANGTNLNFAYAFDTEMSDYNLPDYDLDKATWPLPGFEYGLAIGVISSITIIVLIIRKKK